MRPGPGIWKSGKFGIEKIPKIKILKIKIRVAQNVGKVWISRKKQLPALFGAIPGHFLCGPEKSKKNDEILCIFLGGPMGPIHPVWGNGCNISSAIRISSFPGRYACHSRYHWKFHVD